MTLPPKGSDGCTVGWASSDPLLASATGVVKLPTSSDATVVHTATISPHGVNVTKDFSLTVKVAMDDASAVVADKMAVAIGYGSAIQLRA